METEKKNYEWAQRACLDRAFVLHVPSQTIGQVRAFTFHQENLGDVAGGTITLETKPEPLKIVDPAESDFLVMTNQEVALVSAQLELLKHVMLELLIVATSAGVHQDRAIVIIGAVLVKQGQRLND